MLVVVWAVQRIRRRPINAIVVRRRLEVHLALLVARRVLRGDLFLAVTGLG